MWVRDGDDWLEARSTAAGVLGSLPVPWEEPGPRDARHPGIFSLVVDDPALKTRKLPSVYHGNAQIFAHRDLDAVTRRLVGTIDAVLHARTRATYLVTACRLDDRYGLYTRDVFNRTAFRLEARRAGLVFSEDPHVRMTEAGAFENDEWGAFDPTFVIASNVMSYDGQRDANHGAFLSFVFAILRLGDLSPSELGHLTRLVQRAEVITDDDPAGVVRRLTVR